MFIWKPTCTLTGSCGHCEVDLETGRITPPYGEGDAQDLVCMDLTEWLLAYGRLPEDGEGIDVCDIAAWNRKGVWTPAVAQFRYDAAAMEYPGKTGEEDYDYYREHGRKDAEAWGKLMRRQGCA